MATLLWQQAMERERKRERGGKRERERNIIPQKIELNVLITVIVINTQVTQNFLKKSNSLKKRSWYVFLSKAYLDIQNIIPDIVQREDTLLKKLCEKISAAAAGVAHHGSKHHPNLEQFLCAHLEVRGFGR